MGDAWSSRKVPGWGGAGVLCSDVSPPQIHVTLLGFLIFSEGFPQGVGVSGVNGLWFSL